MIAPLRPLDPLTAELVARLPALALSGLGRKHRKHRQRVLTDYVLDALEGRRAHRTTPDAVYFAWDDLRKQLRCDSAETVDALLLPFFDRSNDYHAGNRTARAFRLRADVRDLARQAVGAVTTRPAARPVDPHSDFRLAQDRIPRLAHDDCDMPRYAATIRPVLSEVTLTHVDQAFAGLAPDDDQGRAWFAEIRQAVARYHGLPNTFTCGSNGRLVPTGRVHLVSMPKPIRNRLLTALDCLDFDLRSCHLSIFRSLGHAWEFPVTELETYCEHKDALHREWAKAVGQPEPDEFKPLVLAMLTGSILSPSPQNTVGRTLGRRIAKKWIALDDVRALYAEVREGMRCIANRPTFADERRNAVGKVLIGGTRGQIVSHVLTGFEQWAIATLVAMMPVSSLLTVVYDGWIVRSASYIGYEYIPTLDEYSATLRDRSIAELGLPLDLTIKMTPYGHGRR